MVAVTPNMSEGVLTHSAMDTPVTARSWPLSFCEREKLEKAGLNGIDSRWIMHCIHSVKLSSDDILTVNDSHYEILASSATKDEFGVEWVLLTRRRP